MSNVRSWRITLEYSVKDNDSVYPPDTWDWWTLVAPETYETVDVVDVQEIPTPQAHTDDFHDREVHDEAL